MGCGDPAVSGITFHVRGKKHPDRNRSGCMEKI
jgi:hypothetical protein